MCTFIVVYAVNTMNVLQKQKSRTFVLTATIIFQIKCENFGSLNCHIRKETRNC